MQNTEKQVIAEIAKGGLLAVAACAQEGHTHLHHHMGDHIHHHGVGSENSSHREDPRDREVDHRDREVDHRGQEVDPHNQEGGRDREEVHCDREVDLHNQDGEGPGDRNMQ